MHVGKLNYFHGTHNLRLYAQYIPLDTDYADLKTTIMQNQLDLQNLDGERVLRQKLMGLEITHICTVT